MPTSAAGHVVGIDLGTTNSLVAYVENGLPVVIRDDDGSGLLPSVVAITADGVVHVGKDAQRRLLIDAHRTAYSIKRLMGKGRADVADEEKYFPFRVTDDDRGVIRVALGEREFTPPELSAFVLRELKGRAEEHFRRRGERDVVVDRAVITVPAYFDDAQRTATRDAGRIAGLEVLRIINEPTAASLAYGLDRGDNARHARHPHSWTVAVYDFGGGTFDISILRVEDGVFQVLATNGDTHLGGDDIDRLIIQRVLAARDGSPDPETLQALRMAAVQAKWDLSERDETTLDGASFRRVELESLIAPLVDRTLASCRQALADAGLDARQIDEVVLVGGSTRIPLVRDQVEALFGRAAHASLNPDEVVALGAAVQANNLVTANRDMLLLDVTPLSLGIETMGGVVSRIIVRNSTIPATGRETFTTAVDDQTGVDIHVLQGERERVSDNRSLARFSLRGIPPMPAGMARVEVQFQIDANGILNVTAHELRTDVAQTVEVKPSYGLTDEEVERMLLDSLEHGEEDLAVRRLTEARNEAEAVIRATEKTLRSPEMEDIQRAELSPEGLTKEEHAKIVAILAALKMVLGSSDVETIQRWTQALNDATAHLAEVALNRSVRAALTGRNVDEL